MSKIVFILGAGASVCAGSPVLSNLYDKAQKLYNRKLLGSSSLDFERLNEAMFQISRSHAQIPLDHENLETVLDALEMAQVIGGFPDIDSQTAKQTTDSIKRLLATVLETSIVFPVSQNKQGNRVVCPPEPYRKFAEILQSCSDSTPSVECSLITFNYDILLDFTLASSRQKYTYCLDGKAPTRSTIRLCKLHGSLNWRKNSSGKIESVMPQNSVLDNWNYFQDEAIGVRIFHDRLFDSSSSDTMEGPYIVPPTHNKLHYHLEIRNVWHQAAVAISEATMVFVIGYSLPPSDQFFRSFLGLSTISKNRFSKFIIIDPSDSAETRYRDLFGTSTAQKRIEFHKHCFEDPIMFALVNARIRSMRE